MISLISLERVLFSLRTSSSCRLQLKLLSFKTLPDFVNLMNGATSFTDLVHDILDLIGESLVFSADLLQLQYSLLIGGLYLEQLRRGITSFLLADVKVE